MSKLELTEFKLPARRGSSWQAHSLRCPPSQAQALAVPVTKPSRGSLVAVASNSSSSFGLSVQASWRLCSGSANKAPRRLRSQQHSILLIAHHSPSQMKAEQLKHAPRSRSPTSGKRCATSSMAYSSNCGMRKHTFQL